MRFKSLLTILVVLFVFFLVEGWMFLERYWFPIDIASIDATIVGTIVDVGSPVAGRVEEVYVFDAQRVRPGERLFLVTPQSQDHPFGGTPIEITSPRAGTIARINVVAGSSIQASQVLGQVIDLSPEALLVDAAFPVAPVDHYRIRAFQAANIYADFLGAAAPLSAVVTSVEPIYDAATGTVRTKVRITGRYPSSAPLASGLPVDVRLTIANENAVRNRIERFAKRVIPSSFAR